MRTPRLRAEGVSPRHVALHQQRWDSDQNLSYYKVFVKILPWVASETLPMVLSSSSWGTQGPGPPCGDAHGLDHWEDNGTCVSWQPSPQGVVLHGTTEKHSPEGWGFHPHRPVGMPTWNTYPVTQKGKMRMNQTPTRKPSSLSFPRVPHTLPCCWDIREWVGVGETIKYMGWFWTQAIPTPHRFY